MTDLDLNFILRGDIGKKNGELKLQKCTLYGQKCKRYFEDETK